jgi:hypothetical protein
VIKWPSGEKLLSVVDGFLTTWGFPQCTGAIDGTHIPIVAPSESSPITTIAMDFILLFFKLLLIISTSTVLIFSG